MAATSSWRTIKIFISSTFSDMHAERDAIRKHVIPRLNAALVSHHISVVTTDLRWGVDTVSLNEEERESKVLRVCLDAIDNSKPYFVALLGERYGWVPSSDRMKRLLKSLGDSGRFILKDDSPKSVTELEILFGAIGSSDLLDHSYFCFRDPDAYGSLPQELKSFYLDSDSSDGGLKRSKLSALKSHIKEMCAGSPERLIDYSPRWDSRASQFIALDDFAENLYQRLLADILAENSSPEIISDSEESLLQEFIAVNAADFSGRKKLLDNLTDYVLHHRTARSILRGEGVVILSGSSGCGKSYIFSSLCRRLEEIASDKNIYVLSHAAGLTAASTSWQNMIDRWCRELYSALDMPLPEDFQGDTDRLTMLVLRMQLSGRFPVLLIDSLDSFSQPESVLDILPFNVPVVCTSLPSTISKLHTRRKFTVLDVNNFDREDATAVIHTVFRRNDKDCSDALVDALLSVGDGKSYTSPLWLRMALTILLELGSADFREINKEAPLADDEKINSYLIKIIKALPPTPESLFKHFIEISSGYFDRQLVLDSLSFIAFSEFGISEDMLATLLGESWNELEFESLRYWLRDFLIRVGNNKLLKLNHNILRQQIIKDTGDEYQRRFFDLLFQKVNDDIDYLDELVFQLINHNDIDRMLELSLSENIDEYLISSAVRETAATLGHQRVADFISAYLGKYYLDNYLKREYIDDTWVDMFLEDAVNRAGRNSIDDPLHSAARPYIDAAENLIAHFTDDEIFSGDRDIITVYFHNNALYIKLLDQIDDKSYLELVNSLVDRFNGLRQRFDSAFLSSDLVHSFFSVCQNALWELRRSSDDGSPLHAVEDTYLDNLEWFISNTRLTWPFETYQLYTAYFLKSRASYTSQRRAEIGRRVYDFFLSLKPDPGSSDYTVEKFNECAEKMAGDYAHFIDDPSYEYGPVESIPDDDAGIVSIEPFPDDWDDFDDNDFDDSGVRTCLRHVEDEDFDNEDYDNDYEDADDDNASFDFSPYSLEAIDQAAADRLDDLPRGSMHGEESFEKLMEWLMIELGAIDRRISEDKPHEALLHIDAVEMFLVKFIFDLDRNYALSDNAVRPLVILSDWYKAHDMEARRIDLFEAVCEELEQSFYHHPDGDAQREAFNTLYSIYEDNDMPDRIVALLEKNYGMVRLWQIEHSFDKFYMSYNDLGYLRPYFNMLFKAYRQRNEIVKAVTLLESWLDMCDITYTDARDLRPGFADYDDAYDNLAKLYDGTPTLVSGMAERNSRFLRDPLIAVCHDGRWGYIDHQGNVRIPCKYTWAWRAFGEVLSVRTDTGWGYIDFNGKPMGRPGFDAAYPICNGRGWTYLNDKYTLANGHSLRLVTLHDIDNIGAFFGDKVKIAISGKQNMLLPDGRTKLFSHDMFRVYASADGSRFVTMRYNDESDSISALWDADGKPLVEEGRFDCITPFGDSALTPVRNDSLYKCGFINRDGNLVIGLKYSSVRPFHEGRAAVAVSKGASSRELWGFIDENGNEIVKPQYNDVGDFHDGRAWVCASSRADGYGFGFRGSKFGLIDLHGQLVEPIIYDDVISLPEQ